jgi:hypothetical protein
LQKLAEAIGKQERKEEQPKHYVAAIDVIPDVQDSSIAILEEEYAPAFNFEFGKDA